MCIRLVTRRNSWMTYELTQKYFLNRTLLKRNKIHLFFKRMVNNDNNWIIYETNIETSLRSNCDELVQTVAMSELLAKKILQYTW